MSDQEGGQLALPDSDDAEAAAAGKTSRPDQPFGDMSEAAREVVHSPADPRLDKHLARIGLAEAAPATSASAASRPPTAQTDGALESQVLEIRGAVKQTNAQLRALLWAVVALIVAVAVLAILVVTR